MTLVPIDKKHLERPNGGKKFACLIILQAPIIMINLLGIDVTCPLVGKLQSPTTRRSLVLQISLDKCWLFER